MNSNLKSLLFLVAGIVIGSAAISGLDKVPDWCYWAIIGVAVAIGLYFIVRSILRSGKITTSYYKSITWPWVLLIIFALSFLPQQSKATTPRFTAIGWTKANIDREQKRAIWKAKKHHKKHRKVIKGNGRRMIVNRVSTCPLNRR